MAAGAGRAACWIPEGPGVVDRLSYLPAGRAEAYGRGYAEAGELLCRLRLDHLTGTRDVAA